MGPPVQEAREDEDHKPRRWQLVRKKDVTGMSGTGVVAEGIQFRDNSVAYKWRTSPSTVQFAESIHDVQHIHGHSGNTRVEFIDD